MDGEPLWHHLAHPAVSKSAFIPHIGREFSAPTLHQNNLMSSWPVADSIIRLCLRQVCCSRVRLASHSANGPGRGCRSLCEFSSASVALPLIHKHNSFWSGAAGQPAGRRGHHCRCVPARVRSAQITPAPRPVLSRPNQDPSHGVPQSHRARNVIPSTP